MLCCIWYKMIKRENSFELVNEKFKLCISYLYISIQFLQQNVGAAPRIVLVWRVSRLTVPRKEEKGAAVVDKL